MNYEFVNGDNQQQSLWQEGFSHLLSMPDSAVPEVVKVEFVPPPLPPGHTDLALTTWSYGSFDASTIVRNDAPSFGPEIKPLEALAASMGIPYSAPKFYMESAAHELGHALYATLPEANRVAIAKLFGAKSDSIEELAPPGSEWTDRIIEGIAETFKEAFLPRAFRVFPNRTHRKIPYNMYPTFRKLWRQGAEQEAPGGETFPPVANLLRVGYDINKRGPEGLWSYAFEEGFEGLNVYLAGSGTSQAGLELPIRPGETVRLSITIPESWFPPPSEFVPTAPTFAWSEDGEQNAGFGLGYLKLFFFMLIEGSTPAEWSGHWFRQTPGESPHPTLPEWEVEGDAVALGKDFPVTISLEVTNESGSVEPLRIVSSISTIGPEISMRYQKWLEAGRPAREEEGERFPYFEGPSDAELAPEIQAAFPTVPYPGYSTGGKGFTPITLPSGLIVPSQGTGASLKTPWPISAGLK